MTTPLRKQKVSLTVERTAGDLRGRVLVTTNLIVASAKSLSELKRSFQSLILDIENVSAAEFHFVVSYDLTSFFNQNPLNIAAVASKAGISPGLMRQYATGAKFPSIDRLQVIESAIRQIGKELSKVRLHKPKSIPS